jgi:NitT/TauT family transport system substrate-binding protein
LARRRDILEEDEMSRLDELIADLTSARISRRQFMQRAAALGLTVPMLTATGSLSAFAQDAKNKVVWVSPRGSLEVLDDYPYWVGQKMGYFGDIQTELLPAILEATSSSKAVADNQADMSYVSPGVFSLGVEAGIDLVSVWEMGAYDVFDIALPKGNPQGITTLKDLEGKTVILGDQGWSSIVDPMVAQAGGDPSKVKYASSGSTWGQTLAAGQGDAALSWEGLRAQWGAGGLDFDYILGKDWSKFPANSFQIRRSDFEDASLKDLYTNYLKGWAMGLEFGFLNPRAATQITMEVPEITKALNDTFKDKNIAVDSMWELATVYRGDWATRQGWGWHDLDSWNLFLTTIKDIGQLTKEIKAEDIIKNDFVAGGNDFDHDKVKADAAAFQLSTDFAAVQDPASATPEATPTS